MGINKEKQKLITVVLEKDVYDKYKELCKTEKRSLSNKTSILIEKFIEESTK